MNRARSTKVLPDVQKALSNLLNDLLVIIFGLPLDDAVIMKVFTEQVMCELMVHVRSVVYYMAVLECGLVGRNVAVVVVASRGIVNAS